MSHAGPDAVPVLLQSRELTVPGRAMQHLAPALHEMFTTSGFGPADLGKIACVRGPGGFTGLRLSLATALGLAKSSNIPMAGIDYFPLLASGPADLLNQGSLWVCTYARRNQVFLQGFSLTSDSLPPPPLTEVLVLDLQQTAQAIVAGPGPAHVLGSGLRRNLDTLPELLNPAQDDPERPGPLLLPPAWDHPSPAHLLAQALPLEATHEPIVPLYLRPSDAEQNIEAIAAKRGVSPDHAKAMLSQPGHK